MGHGWRRRGGGRGGKNWPKKAGPRAKSFVVESEALDEEREQTPRIELEQLTGEQRVAAERVLQGESLFLTGAAGTGKSFLLRFLIQELELRYPGQMGVTAPTGIAAANIGGQTIHSFAGVGLGEGSPQKLLAKVRKSSAAVSRWKKLRVLIIDEVSMLDSALFDALEVIAASIRGIREGRRLAAFGGIQLLMCGDFLQLPPVQGRGKPEKQFCFQAPAWSRCGLDLGTVNLLEPVRQADDSSFASILNEVRMGVVSARAQAMLAQCHVSVKALPDDGIIPTKLYCLNKNVDAENKAQLAKLPGSAKSFRARDSFKGVRNPAQRAALQDMIEKKMPAELNLKIGAQVILIKNNPALKLVNGSRGVVDSFSGDYPVVRFDSGCSARIGQEPVMHGTSSNSVTRVQVPLKLGWALTVHKAQGMTLSRAELQVADAFEAGQAYVALSRLTCSAGLWIRGEGLSSSNTRAHDIVLDFYNSSAIGSSAAPRPPENGSRSSAPAPLPEASVPTRPLGLAARLGARKRARLDSAQAAEHSEKVEEPPVKMQCCAMDEKGIPAPMDPNIPLRDTSGLASLHETRTDSMQTFAMRKEDVAAEVQRLRAILDDLKSTSAQLIGALEALRSFGPLPAHMIKETRVGRSVGALAKRTHVPSNCREVHSHAKELLEAWKGEYRKELQKQREQKQQRQRQKQQQQQQHAASVLTPYNSQQDTYTATVQTSHASNACGSTERVASLDHATDPVTLLQAKSSPAVNTILTEANAVLASGDIEHHQAAGSKPSRAAMRNQLRLLHPQSTTCLGEATASCSSSSAAAFEETSPSSSNQRRSDAAGGACEKTESAANHFGSHLSSNDCRSEATVSAISETGLAPSQSMDRALAIAPDLLQKPKSATNGSGWLQQHSADGGSTSTPSLNELSGCERSVNAERDVQAILDNSRVGMKTPVMFSMECEPATPGQPEPVFSQRTSGWVLPPSTWGGGVICLDD